MRQFREEEQARILQHVNNTPQPNLTQQSANTEQENDVLGGDVNESQRSNHQGDTTLQGPQTNLPVTCHVPRQSLEQIYPGQAHYEHPHLPLFLRRRALDLEAEHHIDRQQERTQAETILSRPGGQRLRQQLLDQIRLNELQRRDEINQLYDLHFRSNAHRPDWSEVHDNNIQDVLGRITASRPPIPTSTQRGPDRRNWERSMPANPVNATEYRMEPQPLRLQSTIPFISHKETREQMTERDRFIASLISTGSSIEMAQRQAAVLMASSSTSSHTAAINREPLSHDAPSSSSAGNGGSPNGGPPGGTSDNSISEFNFAQFLNGFQNQQA